ncbi:MAG TPA: cyclase family protein [Acidimicrobiales bacterium]
MASEYPIPTTEELDTLFASLTSWSRWGADDQRGALNHLTDARRVAATRLVATGETVSLAHDLATDPVPESPQPVQHHMLASGDALDSNGIAGYEAARDHLALDVHGLWTTHVDALSHMFVRGQMYGGRPASEVRSDGARSNTVLTLADGVVGRGVLLDVPRALGCAYLDTGQVVTVDDLEAAEAAQGVRVGPGDILLVAWGREARRRASRGFDGLSGLHASCLPWLAEREVAVLGSDGISDPMPFVGTPEWPFPIHQIGIVAMGLHLIDNARLAPLAARCAELGRWEFLFTMAPLRIPKGTGCPVNPVAVL